MSSHVYLYLVSFITIVRHVILNSLIGPFSEGNFGISSLIGLFSDGNFGISIYFAFKKRFGMGYLMTELTGYGRFHLILLYTCKLQIIMNSAFYNLLAALYKSASPKF